jgi:hypothetical protein
MIDIQLMVELYIYHGIIKIDKKVLDKIYNKYSESEEIKKLINNWKNKKD